MTRGIVDELRSGTPFHQLVLPERADKSAGAYYEAGVGFGQLRWEQRLESRAARSAAAAAGGGAGAGAAVPSRSCRRTTRAAGSTRFSPADRGVALKAKAVLEAGHVPWGLCTLPARLRDPALAARLGSVVVRKASGPGGGAATDHLRWARAACARATRSSELTSRARRSKS